MENGKYYEVDIEYTTGAKMILLGKDEDDIRALLAREFEDIPDLRITAIDIADPDLVAQAKARRAFEDKLEEYEKHQVN